MEMNRRDLVKGALAIAVTQGVDVSRVEATRRPPTGYLKPVQEHLEKLITKRTDVYGSVKTAYVDGVAGHEDGALSQLALRCDWPSGFTVKLRLPTAAASIGINPSWWQLTPLPTLPGIRSISMRSMSM